MKLRNPTKNTQNHVHGTIHVYGWDWRDPRSETWARHPSYFELKKPKKENKYINKEIKKGTRTPSPNSLTWNQVFRISCLETWFHIIRRRRSLRRRRWGAHSLGWMPCTTPLTGEETCGSMRTGSGSWGSSGRAGSPTFTWSRSCSLTPLRPLLLAWLRKSRTPPISLVSSLSSFLSTFQFFRFCDLGHLGVNLKWFSFLLPLAY